MERYKLFFETYTNLNFPKDDLILIAEGKLLLSNIFIFEATIDIKSEIQEIRKILLQAKNNFFKQVNDLNSFESFFNKLLENRKIIFKYTSAIKTDYCTNGSYFETNDIIMIYFGLMVDSVIKNKEFHNYENMIDSILNSMGHELVHRGQAVAIEYENLRHIVFKNITDITLTGNTTWEILKNKLKNKDTEIKSLVIRHIKYLNLPQEIMAHAWKIVNNFRLNGISDEHIKRLLATHNEIKLKLGGQILQDYHFFFPPKSGDTLKKLYKYMYSYLQI